MNSIDRLSMLFVSLPPYSLLTPKIDRTEILGSTVKRRLSGLNCDEHCLLGLRKEQNLGHARAVLAGYSGSPR